MALVKCRECGNDVATSAAACPKCGAPVRRQLLTTRNILLAFCSLGMCYVGSCVVLNLANTPGRRHSPTVAVGEPKQVDIGPLLREYGANELQADANYRGRTIQTRGYVEKLGRDAFDSIYLVLSSARGSEPTDLQCQVSNSQLQSVAKLSQGAHITVQGKVDGLILRTVIVSNCELVGM
ncbi:OB-fold putative lipoprotein [Corallococcus exiguus]|uniref:OB-fold putative lipoprotein n=1 Tax=Corallococcus exiguus TaxID=83462 RepID=UPI001C25D17E|nr:OB-fold putative lipoprotein [Corallococcus exiguus]